MNSTYAQKSSTVQKAADTKAASVLDSSAQNESLQRKADMANGAVQCKHTGSEFINAWRFFRTYVIELRYKSFVMNLNGVRLKFLIDAEDTDHGEETDAHGQQIEVIRLKHSHVELLLKNPIALKQIICHEIGHGFYSRSNQDGPDEVAIRNCNKELIEYETKNLIQEFYCDMYAFSNILDYEMNRSNGMIDVNQIVLKLNLDGRPKNWVEASKGYPPVDVSRRMFVLLYELSERFKGTGTSYHVFFMKNYKFFRDKMIKEMNLYKNELKAGTCIRKFYLPKKNDRTARDTALNELCQNGFWLDSEKKNVNYNGAYYDVSLLLG